MAEVPFERLARLAGTSKVKAVAAWCARNRILTFRDTKGRPCTTETALDRALRRGKDEENEPNYDPPPWANSPAVSTSPGSTKKTGGTTRS